MTKTTFTVEDLLSEYPPPIHGIADELRNVILKAAPGVQEKANRGWRSISFRDEQVGYFCGIFPFEDHVDLIFEFGSLLDDPHNILRGDARQTRYLRFHESGDVDHDTTAFFLRGALDLPASHSIKRGLSQNKP